MSEENVEVSVYEEVIGKVIREIERICDTSLIFTFEDGEVWEMYHQQDCCEYVRIEDICGELDDLIGMPLLQSEEVTKVDLNACESGMWTFYKLATNRGAVTIRWYGSSNGYYSESVTFKKRD